MSTTETIAATPAKLNSGSWGARVSGASVLVGDTVTITTRAGKSWDAVVSDIVWSRRGVTLCATESTSTGGRSTHSSRRTYRGRGQRSAEEGYCRYPCNVSGQICCPANGPCHDCE